MCCSLFVIQPYPSSVPHPFLPTLVQLILDIVDNEVEWSNTLAHKISDNLTDSGYGSAEDVSTVDSEEADREVHRVSPPFTLSTPNFRLTRFPSFAGCLSRGLARTRSVASQHRRQGPPGREFILSSVTL